MCVEDTSILIVPPVDLEEVGPEIVQRRFVIIFTVTKRSYALSESV